MKRLIDEVNAYRLIVSSCSKETLITDGCAHVDPCRGRVSSRGKGLNGPCEVHESGSFITQCQKGLHHAEGGTEPSLYVMDNSTSLKAP